MRKVMRGRPNQLRGAHFENGQNNAFEKIIKVRINLAKLYIRGGVGFQKEAFRDKIRW
jgi:hypothetical protein